jgi:hypothetical protein
MTFNRHEYSKYGAGSKTRIKIVAKKDGRKTRYLWWVEQKSSWATDSERAQEGWVERPAEWRRVQVRVYRNDDIWNPYENNLYGTEKTHEKAEVAARCELAKVIAWFNERNRNAEWESNNTTVLKA